MRLLFDRMRTYLIAGTLVTAPLAITLYFAWLVLSFIDRQMVPLLPDRYNPNTYLPFGLPGLGVVILVLLLTVIGAVAARGLGRFAVRSGEHVMGRMPVLRGVHAAVKQVIEAVLTCRATAFRQVVILEYPRRDIWAIGFVSSETRGEVRERIGHDLISVFVPTTPNPTSGVLVFAPQEDCIFLSMSVEEGIKMVVSGGLVTPAFHDKKDETSLADTERHRDRITLKNLKE